MRSLISKTCILSAVCILIIHISAAQDSKQIIAVITGLSGNVQVKKVGKPEFAKALWGTQLFQGDQVRTGTGSEATLTFSNSNIMTLAPGNTYTVHGDGSAKTEAGTKVKKVSSAMMADMSVLTTRREEKKDFGALAGLRAIVTEEPIEPTSPYNTLIKTNRPTFTWIPKKTFDKFIVNLYSSKGLVWSKEVSENMLKFPESEKELDFGETYFWNVEGEDLLDNKKSPSYKFSVLSIDKSKEVLNEEALIRATFENDSDSSSLHSFLGAFYINQGLLQDAIKEFEIISRMNPDAPLPHEILGSLYSDVGNKDKAIEELQKALALSKNKDK